MKKKLRLTVFLPLICMLSACGQEPPAEPEAETGSGLTGDTSAVNVIYNAQIYTSNEDQPIVEAMAFNDAGEILLLGSSQKIQSAYPGANSRNLQGKTVIPGLIDSHGHLTNLALSLTRAQLVGTANKEEIIQRLKAHEKNLADQDWLLGRGWDQNDWPEQEFPNRQDLDEHFPLRPV